MSVVIISDLHSNIEALDAVLGHAQTLARESRGRIDAVWCTGDIVGYGADPAAVIARVRQIDAVCVAGNHDLVACGKMDVEDFNPIAATAALWQGTQLAPEERDWLASLPLVRQVGRAQGRSESTFTLVHGSLRAPEWEYLLDEEAAEAHFALQTTPYSFVGHSHQQFHVVEDPGGPRFVPAANASRAVFGDRRLILNSGSTGQPRDGDPRAGYILYDQDAATATWYRVEYDIPAAQKKIVDAGLNTWLAERLAIGH
ncbi:MAG: metallophosphoesterase [Chloroflexi bacterium]|nr:metallophosphoesterase [Chloroflexota bacterium]